jgi:hypothetical protein
VSGSFAECGLAWTSGTRRAAFLIADAGMQNYPDQLPHAMRDYPDVFLVSKARYQATNCRFHYSNAAISIDLNCAEGLSTPLFLSSGIATIIRLLIQNQLFDRSSKENRQTRVPIPASGRCRYQLTILRVSSANLTLRA